MNLEDIGWDSEDCIELSQDRDQWMRKGGSCEHESEFSRSVKCMGSSGVAERLTASEEGPRFVELYLYEELRLRRQDINLTI